jgi:hypothetical protein
MTVHRTPGFDVRNQKSERGGRTRRGNQTGEAQFPGKPCYFVGTRAFSSASQFCTRIICEAEIGARSFCLTIRKR